MSADQRDGSIQGRCESIARRSFLVRSGALSVGIVFTSMPSIGTAQSKSYQANGWIQISGDDTVVIYCGSAEMGQGAMTALPMLVAEDLDADWSKVQVEQAPHDPKIFGNPAFNGDMTTGGSRTTRGLYEVMRMAGLQAREILRSNAAQHWNVALDQVATENHEVFDRSSGRRMRYGAVAMLAQTPDWIDIDLLAAKSLQLKPPSQFRLLGRDVPRVDVPGKSRGDGRFGIDVDLPGMLHASVLRAPVQGEAPLRIDDGEALKIDGVRRVVQLPYGVGVVADSWWAARKARDALKVDWSESAKARGYSSAAALTEYLARARDTQDLGVEYVRKGETEAGFAREGVKVVEAEFTAQHIAHACLEPMNCTAKVDGDTVEIWAPTQAQSRAVAFAARQGFKPDRIRCNVTWMGGGFGRRLEADYVVDAVLLAKALPGVPIKVLWTREDDIQNDKYRPLVAQHLTAAIDGDGMLVGLRHRIVSESIFARAAPPVFEKTGGRDEQVCDGAQHPGYDLSDHVLYYLREQRGVDVGFWRAIGSGYTKFAIETLMDDLALMAGQDPLAFRIRNLAHEPRAQAVLRRVADLAQWTRPRSAKRALGIAYSNAFQTHAAQVSEVSIDEATGRIRVHEVWIVADPGIALLPRNVVSQIESGVMQGLSAALGEKIVIEKGRPLSSNFFDYPVLRMNEAPVIHTVLLSGGPNVGGVGEVGVPLVAATMSNAVLRLTGKRLRDLPLEVGKTSA